MKNVTALRHVSFEDLGSLEGVLSLRGYQVQYLEAGWNDLKSIDPCNADLFVILGGPIGVYDQANYPFLQDEMRIIQKRLEADLPTLGICLGAQLIARVLGASVYPGRNGKEIGWSSITLSSAARQSPLKHIGHCSVLHWHGDTFDLPADCTYLASSMKYENQAFSYKQNCLALQFHPEVYPRGLERWLIGHANEISTSGVEIPQLRSDIQTYAYQLEIAANLMWNDWLDQIELSLNKNTFRSMMYS